MPERIVVASDHAGFPLKEKVKAHLERRGLAVEDLGTHSLDSVDYPMFGHRLAEEVASGRFARGVAVCGTGIGVSIAVNRHRGVRAAVAWNETSARLSREHNDANVLALGGRTLDHDAALRILDVWLDTAFEGGRHARRVEQIDTGSTGSGSR
jgi:RpiB/LacA/LacB family sugar-phosphate isomerase